MKTSASIMKRCKLANVLFDGDRLPAGGAELLYRTDAPVSYDSLSGEFTFSGTVDFRTYFNGISAAKWHRYANVVAIRLHLELMGDACVVEAAGMTVGPDDCVITSHGEAVASEAHEEFVQVEVDMPLEGAGVAGFVIRSQGTTRVRRAFYYTLVEASRIHPVRIAVCVAAVGDGQRTLALIGHLLRGLLEDEEQVEHFGLFVIDDQQAIPEDAISDERVTVLHSIDAGTAGMAARAMMAVLDDSADYSHLLLLRGDAQPSIEGLRRMRALLSLANPQYVRSPMQGALLEADHPDVLFQDVTQVRVDGKSERLKPDLHIDTLHDLVANEGCDLGVSRVSGSWRFCCLPTAMVRENGLPLPLYAGGDDTEYDMRCASRYMTMNGIGAWRPRDAERYLASMDCYLDARNTLVGIAVDNCGSEAAFMARFNRRFHEMLRALDYQSAEQLLDGLEDYLKGPDFLMESDSAQVMQEQRERDEALEPIENIDSPLRGDVRGRSELPAANASRPGILKLVATLPHDRHRLPEWMLLKKPGVVPSDAGADFSWTSMAMRKNLVALSADGTQGAVRQLDRERFRQLQTRYQELRFEYRNRNQMVSERYRDEFRRMTSREFWRRHLDLD